MTQVAGGFLARLDRDDRLLLERWALTDASAALARGGWRAVTHLGGAGVTIAAVLVPMLLAPGLAGAARRGAVALALSHAVVQLVKRTVQRSRPAGTPLIACPDRFSFPSGHATASMAVLLTYALAWPAIGWPLVVLGMVVGWSRVALGVHYPGDVAIGQLIAIVTVLLLRAGG